MKPQFLVNYSSRVMRFDDDYPVIANDNGKIIGGIVTWRKERWAVDIQPTSPKYQGKVFATGGEKLRDDIRVMGKSFNINSWEAYQELKAAKAEEAKVDAEISRQIHIASKAKQVVSFGASVNYASEDAEITEFPEWIVRAAIAVQAFQTAETHPAIEAGMQERGFFRISLSTPTLDREGIKYRKIVEISLTEALAVIGDVRNISFNDYIGLLNNENLR